MKSLDVVIKELEKRFSYDIIVDEIMQQIGGCEKFLKLVHKLLNRYAIPSPNVINPNDIKVYELLDQEFETLMPKLASWIKEYKAGVCIS